MTGGMVLAAVVLALGGDPSVMAEQGGAMAPAKAAPVCGYQVVNVYPHDPGAFTQGLLFADGDLFESTGLYGESSLRRVALASGAVTQLHELAGFYFGEGLTLHGGILYQLTWQSNIAFTYDDHSFQELGQLTYPTQGWGLTDDGTRMIMSDGSAFLYFRDPATFAELGRVEVSDGGVAVTLLNELEFAHGEVLANVWYSDRLARIHPVTGQVLSWIDLTGLLAQAPGVLNGIAWDAELDRLFVTGKRWPSLFEIELVGCALGEVFSDGFESGDASLWTEVTSNRPHTELQWILSHTR